MTVWYRVVDVTWYEDNGEVDRQIIVREFSVIRETEKSVLLDVGKYKKPKWVLKDARKRFAYPTKALALNSYRVRKRWQVTWLESQLENAKLFRITAAIIEGLTSRD